MKKPYSYDFPSLFPGKTQFCLIIQKKNRQDLVKCHGFLGNVKKKVSRLSDWLNSEFTTDLYLF